MPEPGLVRTDARGTGARRRADAARGCEAGEDEVGRRSASYWRMDVMRRVLEPRMHAAGLALWLLRFSVRGWNRDLGPEPSPVPDARWALEEVRAAHPDLPVVLLGHSMGARTAVHVADDPAVVGVTALAPWLEPSDPVAPLAGRHLVAGHGSRDRITSPRMTREFVRRASSVAESAEFVDVGRVGHYMLARPALWNRFALRGTLEVLARAGVGEITPG